MNEYLPILALGVGASLLIFIGLWLLLSQEAHGSENSQMPDFITQDIEERKRRNTLIADCLHQTLTSKEAITTCPDDDTQEWTFDPSVLEAEPLPAAFEDYFVELWAKQNTSHIENQLRWEFELDKPEESGEE